MTQVAPTTPLVDTHLHLDDPAFDEDREAVISASRDAGVVRFINIGYRPESWEASRALREANPDFDIVLGLHPAHANQYDATLDRCLLDAIRAMKPIAIGETGFDFARPHPGLEAQVRAFRRQLEIAAAERLPIVIHQRQAGDALVKELDRWPHMTHIVLHSFDGDQRLMDWAVERDCYVGIGGLASRKKSEELRGVLSHAPVHRILLETDAPYLSPPGAPNRRNSPAHLPLIAQILSPIWNLSAEELCLRTTENANELFGVPIDPRPDMHRWSTTSGNTP